MHYWLLFISLIAAGQADARSPEPKGTLVERIVAVVNDKTILLSDVREGFEHYREEIKTRSPQEKVDDTPEMERKILDQLVNTALVEDEIQRRGLAANDSTVDGAVATVMKQNNMKSLADLTHALKAEGVGLEEYRSTIKKQIETSRLINDAIRPKVQVSDQDVQAEFKRKNENAGKDPLVHVRMIFKKKGSKGADKKSVERLLRQIRAGIPFERLADKETEGPGKGEGGSLGAVSPKDMQAELGKAVKTMKPGDVSDVIATPQGFYILQCVEFVKPGNAQLTDSAKNDLKEQLTNAETDRAFGNFIRDLRTKAHIEILL